MRFHQIEAEICASRKIRKTFDCSAICRTISTKSWQTIIYIGVILNTKFHEILIISSRATLATKFFSHTHRHTDRQTFSRNNQIVFRTLKSVNPSKTGSRNFLRKQYFLWFISKKVIYIYITCILIYLINKDFHNKA